MTFIVRGALRPPKVLRRLEYVRFCLVRLGTAIGWSYRDNALRGHMLVS